MKFKLYNELGEHYKDFFPRPSDRFLEENRRMRDVYEEENLYEA